jgi:hypothetical protein
MMAAPRCPSTSRDTRLVAVCRQGRIAGRWELAVNSSGMAGVVVPQDKFMSSCHEHISKNTSYTVETLIQHHRLAGAE